MIRFRSTDSLDFNKNLKLDIIVYKSFRTHELHLNLLQPLDVGGHDLLGLQLQPPLLPQLPNHENNDKSNPRTFKLQYAIPILHCLELLGASAAPRQRRIPTRYSFDFLTDFEVQFGCFGHSLSSYLFIYLLRGLDNIITSLSRSTEQFHVDI